MIVKRQRWTPGAVVAISLGNRFHTYAQMLNDPEYAFFDCHTVDDIAPTAVVDRPVLFRLWVMRSAHASGRWPKVGTASLSAELQKPVYRYNQDPLQPQDIRLTFDGCDGPLVTVAKCKGLECAAVWDAEHVEDRLRAHYANVPCKWTLSLRPKRIARKP